MAVRGPFSAQMTIVARRSSYVVGDWQEGLANLIEMPVLRMAWPESSGVGEAGGSDLLVAISLSMTSSMLSRSAARIVLA